MFKITLYAFIVFSHDMQTSPACASDPVKVWNAIEKDCEFC